MELSRLAVLLEVAVWHPIPSSVKINSKTSAVILPGMRKLVI